MEDAAPQQPKRTQKKPSYSIGAPLRDYLKKFRRERILPVTYERLRHFHEAFPLADADGRATLWDSVIYQSGDISALNEGLDKS